MAIADIVLNLKPMSEEIEEEEEAYENYDRSVDELVIDTSTLSLEIIIESVIESPEVSSGLFGEEQLTQPQGQVS